jgi:predicted helicase
MTGVRASGTADTYVALLLRDPRTQHGGRHVVATTFRQLLQQFDEAATTTTAKGRRFERFCKSYFATHPYWAAQFEEVWLWDEWPARTGQDTGIDLVARATGTDELVAIQCKFYKPSSTLSLQHVSSFLSAVADIRFDRGLIVSTAGKVSGHVVSHMDGHAKEIRLLGVEDFENEDPIDWDQFSIEQPGQLALKEPKELRLHQKQAISDVLDGFVQHDRGQMIMACGTGKTFTALRLAEEQVGVGGTILFLVPSINLLSQTVFAWFADAEVPIAGFAVCSDAQAGRRSDSDMSANDLAFPATTNVDALVRELDARAEQRKTSMTVIFSTYQSIDVIAEAQQAGLDTFDLVICDEAHRTTGASKPGIIEESHFTKVHSNDNVAGELRLYMTATPRIYGDQTKAKANDNDVVLASMDDPATFGPQFHELKFGAAVEQGLLTDYKVVVLAVNEAHIPEAFQSILASPDGAELQLSDVAKMVGCWHALSKRGAQFGADDDGIPMQRAVAFTSRIEESKQFAATFPALVTQANLDRWEDTQAVSIEADHVDGSTSVTVRQDKIRWLEEQPGLQTCRVLSNAKCLTEGVDVPALDAVMFLKPRKSLVDIVQAVGRVMRKHEDKDYGYVILPIGIPAGVEPEEALADNERYRVVWEVLQALRSHDERLAAEIDKINLNKRSSKVNVIGIGVGGGDEPDEPGVTITEDPVDVEQLQIDLPSLDAWREMLYAKIVEKVGSRRYMEQWADDIQQIAEAHKQRIEALLAHPDQNPEAVAHFNTFLDALRENLNDSVGRSDAVDMLAQHMITRPIFESLFGHGRFQANNPISKTMQSMLDELDTANVGAEAKTLDAFYRAIEIRLSDIDTAEGKQTVINNLYEQFFKRALPKAAASLGIVYTPVEIVDFINRAVDDLLDKHFGGASISDEGVHVLDPFAGTGTFITRLLQAGLIREDDLERKYRSELHANEIMLLAYYIAAANIETVYQHLTDDGGEGKYVPFDGIVLADTFAMTEGDGTIVNEIFPHNNARADRQKALDIRVIVGNPPYSVGQTSMDDANENLKYPQLDGSIASTYVARSTGNPRSLYDSYVRAMRWASNRIQSSPDGGIVGFVSNGGWLDGNTADGIRRTFSEEFHHVYVLNLRGNTRTSGEQALQEGGQTFGPGSRTTIAITLLVKQPGDVPVDGAQIHYRDIGDYLTREEKLEIVDGATVESIKWAPIEPNESADWINQRDPRYDDLVALTGEAGIFHTYHRGVETGRDAWVYNSSRQVLLDSVTRMIEFFNEQVIKYAGRITGGTKSERVKTARALADRAPDQFSWTNGAFGRLADGTPMRAEPTMFRTGLYRPFMRQHLAFDSQFNQQTNGLGDFFPSGDSDNVGFYAIRSTTKGFAVLASGYQPDVALYGSESGQFVSRWRYEEPVGGETLPGLDGTRKVSNLNHRTVQRFRDVVGEDIDDDDVFAYVYGVLHSPQFRDTFAVSLKKEAPRVPLVDDRGTFDQFRAAGQQLLDLHADYEQADPYPLREEWAEGADLDKNPDVLLVGSKKMRHPDAIDPQTGTTLRDERGQPVKDKSRLAYNDHLTLSGIPPEAHEYRLGTRSGIDWIIDRWRVTTDSKSGIVNDVNQWGLEQNYPRYIVDLVKRVVTVSLRTVRVVSQLPELEFRQGSSQPRRLDAAEPPESLREAVAYSHEDEPTHGATIALAAESSPTRGDEYGRGARQPSDRRTTET